MPINQSAFISCDLALFVRLLEVAREELKGDEDLHKFVERISAQQAGKGEALTMEDYDAIMSPTLKAGTCQLFTEAEVRALGRQAAQQAQVFATAQKVLRQPHLLAAKRLRAASAEEEVSIDVTISGQPECVERALASLYLLYRNGGVGHSGIFGAYWDGDGSDKIQLEGLPKEMTKKFSELADALSNYGGCAELVGENLTGFVLSNDSSGGHYCKHTKVFPKEED